MEVYIINHWRPMTMDDEKKKIYIIEIGPKESKLDDQSLAELIAKRIEETLKQQAKEEKEKKEKGKK